MASIKDVAAYAHVSVSTVSRVLNSHPDVSADAREKVMAAVDALHYVPNSAARDLVLPTSNTLGVVVRGAENPFYTPIIHAIEEVCDERGYTMVLHQISAQGNEVIAAAELERSKRLRGIVFLGGRFDYCREEMLPVQSPFVCCTNSNIFGDLPKDGYSSVSIDDIRVGYDATRTLINAGHAKIALVIDSDHDHSISQLRLDGYCQALNEAHIPFDEGLVVQTVDFTMSATYDKVGELLAQRRDFTAMFCVADSMAIAARRALHDGGLSVPEDVSLIAVDGIEMSLYMVPTLTTFCQPQEELGRTAAQTLINVLEGEGSHRHIRLDATLREGATVLAVP